MFTAIRRASSRVFVHSDSIVGTGAASKRKFLATQ
jgi:hypothetical protein